MKNCAIYTNPFVGLRPFESHESLFFFGRTDQTLELLEKLKNNKFLAVIGSSGCGKSSLIRAGLIPKLKAGMLVDDRDKWFIATMKPGKHPRRHFVEALLNAIPNENFTADPDELDEDIQYNGVSAMLERLEPVLTDNDANLLILVDQFEEIFRFNRTFDKMHIDYEARSEAADFIYLMLDLAEQRTVPVYVIITMRSDFIGDCNAFWDLPEALNRSLYLVPRMSRKQRQDAIECPFRFYQKSITPRLTDRMLNDMGNDPDQLPLIQHILMRMWEKFLQDDGNDTLDLKHYKAVGTIKEALSIHAEEALSDYDVKDELELTEQIFRALTDFDENNRYIRHPIHISQLEKITGKSREKICQIVKSFSEEGRSFLIKSKEQDNDFSIDISHESFIRKWLRLKEWAKEEADSVRHYCRLEDRACQKYNKKGGELLTGVDLKNALDWKKRQKPNSDWAKRHGSNEKSFEQVIEFIDDSVKQKWKNYILISMFVILFVCLTAWGGWNKYTETQRTQHLFESYLSQSSQQARIENYSESYEILNKSHELDSRILSERRHASNLMSWYVNLMRGTPDKIYEGTGKILYNNAVSSDNHLLAAVGQKGTVLLFNTENGKYKLLQGHDDTIDVWGVIIHPDNKWLVTAGEDKQIIFWTLSDGKEIRRWSASAKVHGLALSPDGNILASGGSDKNITLWDINSGEILKTFQGHTDNIFSIDFSVDGKHLASASYDKTAIIWDLESGEPLHILKRHTDKVVKVAFHPDGHLLATSSSDKTIRLWDVESGEAENILQGHDDKVWGLAFFDSGHRIVSASHDRTLRIWETESGVLLKKLQGHLEEVISVSATDDYLFSSGKDGTLRRWNIDSESEMKIVYDMPDKPCSVAIAPDNSKIAVGFDNGNLSLYELPDIYQVWEIKKAHEDNITSLVFSPDGKHLATAAMRDRTIGLWDVSNAQLEDIFYHSGEDVYCVEFSPNGNLIASAGSDGRIGLLDIDKKRSHFYDAHEGSVLSVTFNRNGNKLLSTGEDGNTKLWSLDANHNLKQIKEFQKSRNWVRWAEFSPDENHISVVGYDPIVRIFKTNDGSEEQALIGHKHLVFRAAFSPDGGQVVTLGSDATIRFWDWRKGTELFALHLPTKNSFATQIWDFDFQCTSSRENCYIAVPLMKDDKLVLYNLGNIYKKEASQKIFPIFKVKDKRGFLPK